MKKFLLILLVLIFGSVGFCACEINCPSPYDLTSPVSRMLSTVTGQKFLAQKIGAKIIKKSVKKNIISGDIKTNLKTYSVRDLKAGRFKSIEIKGKNVNAQGVHLSSFTAKTICDFNYVTQDENGNIILKEDMPFALVVTMSEDDINKTMQSSDYRRMVDNINSIGGSFNIFQINTTTVRVKNDKIYYAMKYTIPFIRTTKEVVFSANLHVDDGNINFANTVYENKSSNVDLDKFSKILNYINPLDFSARVLENKDAKFNVEKVNVNDGTVTISGKIVVLKDKE